MTWSSLGEWAMRIHSTLASYARKSVRPAGQRHLAFLLLSAGFAARALMILVTLTCSVDRYVQARPGQSFGTAHRPGAGGGGFSLYLCMVRAMAQSGSQATSFISSVVCQGKLNTFTRRLSAATIFRAASSGSRSQGM